MKLYLTLFTICSAAGASIAGISATVQDPGAWDPDPAALNSNLGITADYTIESFESASLHPGLSITIPGHTSYTRKTGPGVVDEVWSGEWALHNVDETPQDGRDVRLDFQYGAISVGIGVSHLEQNTHIIVNQGRSSEVDLGDIHGIPDFVHGGPDVRNGYLWLTTSGGDRIYSITFDGPDLSDTFYLDHIAWLVPEQCNTADIAAPFGVLDLQDVTEFINQFLGGCP